MAMPAERVEEGICGSVIALSGCTKDAGGRTGGNEEIQFRVLQSCVKIKCSLDFGRYGCEPITVRHVLE